MNPFVVGSLISGGADILGGVVDSVLGPPTAGRAAAAEMKAKILTGRQFGLHPLASIGAQAGGGYTGSYIGEGIAKAGEAMQQGLAAKHNRVLDAKNAELLDAQIAETRSRTLLNRAEAVSRIPLDPYAPRKENALISLKLENGDIITIPNPDVYEISPAELATGRGIIEGARIIQHEGSGPEPDFRRPRKSRAEDMGPYGLP